MALQIVTIGECMLEFIPENDTNWKLDFAGDVYNTTVLMSRLGLSTAFVTAIGTDRYSDSMLQRFGSELIDCRFVLRNHTRKPGLYVVANDEKGERYFTYWRDTSAARTLFDLEGIENIVPKLSSTQVLYFSGITLSLFGDKGRMRLVEICAEVRRNGGIIVFDPNYRPDGWSDQLNAQTAIATLAPYVTLALPTFIDEANLWGDETADQVIDRWCDWGAHEVVVKRGREAVKIGTLTERIQTPPPSRVIPVDTTGAGDAFNAAYVAARLRGQDAVVAVNAGHQLAGITIRHRGAIPPKSPSWAIDLT